MSVKHALLALLDNRSMYGYELRQEFESEIGDHWTLNFGQVYLTLESLEKHGLVKYRVVPGESAPDRKVYKITAEGRRNLADWFHAPVESQKGLRDEFYLKFMLGLNSPRVDIAEIVLTQKQSVLHKLHEYTKLKREAGRAGDIAKVMLLDLVLLRAEADIRWLDMCEVRLDKLMKTGRSMPERKTTQSRPRQPVLVKED